MTNNNDKFSKFYSYLQEEKKKSEDSIAKISPSMPIYSDLKSTKGDDEDELMRSETFSIASSASAQLKAHTLHSEAKNFCGDVITKVSDLKTQIKDKEKEKIILEEQLRMFREKETQNIENWFKFFFIFLHSGHFFHLNFNFLLQETKRERNS